MKLRAILAKFYGCSPTHLRDLTGYELQASIDLAEELTERM